MFVSSTGSSGRRLFVVGLLTNHELIVICIKKLSSRPSFKSEILNITDNAYPCQYIKQPAHFRQCNLTSNLIKTKSLDDIQNIRFIQH
jgi:hypothetical protein